MILDKLTTDFLKCIECNIEKTLDKYKKNHAKYRETHTEELKEYFKQRNIEDKELLREYRKNWYQENKKSINKKSLEKRKNDVETKIAHSLRNRILKVLKGSSKSASTLSLLGCSLEQLKTHLKCKFRDGMSWENHGVLWHIDHIMPCAKFDLSLQENQQKCFHYSNLQPLLAEENLSKGKKVLV